MVTCRKVAKFHGIPISCTGHKPLLLATVSGAWAAKGSVFIAWMGAVLCPVHGLLPTSCPPFPACRVAASVPSFMPPAIPCCPCCAGVDAAGRTFVWVARRARKRVLQVRPAAAVCCRAAQLAAGSSRLQQGRNVHCFLVLSAGSVSPHLSHALLDWTPVKLSFNCSPMRSSAPSPPSTGLAACPGSTGASRDGGCRCELPLPALHVVTCRCRCEKGAGAATGWGCLF